MQVGELWVKIGGRSEALKAALKDADITLKSSGEKLSFIGKDLTKKITLPLVGAGAAATALVAKLGWGRLKAMDAAKAQLEGLGYTLEDVERISEQVKKSVQGTTTTMAEGTSIAAGALAAGVAEGAELEAYIKRVGNAAIGANRPIADMATIFNRVQGLGKLMTMELNMIEDGMPGFAIAMSESLGVTQEKFREMVTDGKVSSEQFMLVMDDFAGGMAEAYAKTWSGMVANTKSNIGILGESLLSGVFQQSKESIAEFLELLRSPVARDWAKETGQAIGSAFGELIVSAKNLVAWWSGLDDGTKKLILSSVAFLVALGPLLTISGKLALSVNSLIKLTSTVKNVMAAAGLTFKAVALAGGGLTLALAALVTAGVLVYKNWDMIKYYGLQAWGSLKTEVLKSIGAIAGAYEKLYGWVPVLGDKIRAVHAKIRASILEEQNILANRTAYSSGTTGMADFRILDQASIKNVDGLGDSIDAVVPKLSGLGGAASGAAEKVKKETKDIAEIIQEKWQGITDSLKNSLSQVRLTYEITANQLHMTGTKAQQLVNDITSLTAQISAQREVVTAANDGYEEMAQAKGETSEEAQNLKLKLIEEQKALSDLEKQLYDTTEALKDHAQEFRDLSDEIDKAEKKYREDLVAALEDYQKKVQQVNEKIVQDEQKVTDEYKKALDSRADALRNFVGLFDQVSDKNVSGADLLANLKGQVAAFEDWSDNIQALAARGVNKGLVEELREMGPKAGPEIAALNTLTDEQLTEYVALWKEKNQRARAEAVTQLKQQRVEMEEKLQEIRNVAAEQLEQYRVEWAEKNAEIRKNAEEEMTRIQTKFESIAKAGTAYGVQLMRNFTSGMESQFSSLRDTLDAAASIVDSYMPHSPAKVGPLKRLNEWGPALVRTFADGITRSLPKLATAMAGMASLSPAMAGAGSSTTSNHYGGNTFHIHVSGGSSREQVDNLLRELRRRGVRL